MILQSLTITRNESYQARPGEYTGRLSYKNQYGDISLNLNEQTSKKILDVIAEQMVESSKQLASELTGSCIEAISTDKQLGVDTGTQGA